MESEGSYLHAIKSDPGSPGEVCYPSLPIGHQHQDLSVGPSPEGSEQACGTWVFTPLCHSDSPTVYEPSVAVTTLSHTPIENKLAARSGSCIPEAMELVSCHKRFRTQRD
ncbi:hypothetical protein HZ326_30233 [Fusarium oxysporum f. sp. albedinis]|nr:hypothetical protein HZ326_30233 [Fusarium oxysporum f. sp. albedinis]